MPENTSTNEFAKRMLNRPIPPSLTDPFHVDPPALICRAFGGREWFFDNEACAIHRVGIFLGLGWRLPRYVQRPDGIDMVRVTTERHHGALSMLFLHCGDRPPEEAETVVSHYGVPYDQLLETYERTLNG